MGNLVLSFTIAIAAAGVLVALSKTLELDTYINRILPIIPILYAIIYEVLERKKTGKPKTLAASAQRREETRPDSPVLFSNITAGKVVFDVAVGLAAKTVMEVVLTSIFIFLTGQTFEQLYGPFGIETVGKFLRGDHPWLTVTGGLYILALLSILTGFWTGLWIGHTTKGSAMLEGVIAGAAITVITAMTNTVLLYRRIEEATNEMAASFGLGVRIGFIAVLLLQVLLYGLWSGLAQKTKEDKAASVVKKPGRQRS